ncbi:hypothetical protein Z043_120399 [Scleropages formosus]|uniref:C2H2-type domain-containing protein n=1 Tax=Scleropages formosus TaxID=113540 RepID=A0A0N8JWP3_SCLFO|nr:hypothetical protein Z043_120399 [Scleropages formosus]
MSEAIVTFQSQLSGIMETVLKAAVCEITSLVEGSFQGEMLRSRQEVEFLKQRLQWSERRWTERERERGRGGGAKCVECGCAADSTLVMESRISRTQSGTKEGPAVKEEKGPVKKQSSCLWETLAAGMDICADSINTEEKQSITREGVEEQVESVMVQHSAEKICRLQPGPECSSADPHDLNSERIMYEKVTVLTDDVSDAESDVLDFVRASESNSRPSPELIHAQDKPHHTAEESERMQINNVISLSHIHNSKETENLSLQNKLPLRRSAGKHIQAAGWKTTMQANTDIPSENIFDQMNFTASKHFTLFPDTGTGDSQNICIYCGKNFFYISRLKIHLLKHTGEKPFSCTQCGRRFTVARNLERHQKIHWGDATFCCGQCGKRFRRADHLKVHQRVHTGERPYCCTQCNKCFRFSGDLNTHKRVHTGEKPYRCTLCGSQFSQLRQLKSHMRVHKGVGRHLAQ